MMQILLILLCGVRFISAEMNDHRFVIMCEGDSNTQRDEATNLSWPAQTRALVDDYEDYLVKNASDSGKRVIDMVSRASVYIDPYYQSSSICLILGGINDIYGAASSDSVYHSIRTFCEARQAADWYMIVMTYPHDTMTVVNDSLRLYWPLFADGIIDIAAAPHIGEGTDHTNPVYFDDPIHMTPTGYAIIADSVYKHVGSLI